MSICIHHILGQVSLENKCSPKVVGGLEELDTVMLFRQLFLNSGKILFWNLHKYVGSLYKKHEFHRVVITIFMFTLCALFNISKKFHAFPHDKYLWS